MLINLNSSVSFFSYTISFIKEDRLRFAISCIALGILFSGITYWIYSYFWLNRHVQPRNFSQLRTDLLYKGKVRVSQTSNELKKANQKGLVENQEGKSNKITGTSNFLEIKKLDPLTHEEEIFDEWQEVDNIELMDDDQLNKDVDDYLKGLII